MPEIILYSSTGCPYCETMKKEFKEWGFTFEERNVTENPDYFNDLHEKGMFSTPVAFIDGEAFIGYRPKKMKKKLGIDDKEVKNQQTDYQQDQIDQETIFTNIKDPILDDVYDFVTIGGGPTGASAAV